MSVCKPEKLQEFKSRYSTIFVVDKMQAHVPHLFKTKKISLIFVGLATKSYIMLEKESSFGKVATKGIPNKTNENKDLISLVNFLRTLFELDKFRPKAVVRGIKCNSLKNMCTYVQEKQGLARLCPKQGYFKCGLCYFPRELKDDLETLNQIYPYGDECCCDLELMWEQIKKLSIENPLMRLKIPQKLNS